MSFLFIKDLGECHEEPLSINHFHWLYSILCPSISIISHSIITLHHSCTSPSDSSLTSHPPNWPSIKRDGYLIVVTQEPTIRNFSAATQEPVVRENSCCCHTRTSSKKRIIAVATQEPAVRKEVLLLPHRNQQYKTVLCCHIKIMRRNKAADTFIERKW